MAESGNLLKRFKWRYWQHPGMNLPPIMMQNDKVERVEIAVEELPAQFNREIQSWEFEFRRRSAFGLRCRVARRHLGREAFLDSVHEKMDFSATIAAIQSFRAKYPQTSGIFIENRANGSAAINTLEHQVPGINRVSPSRSKYDRAFASSDELNAGNWYLPHPQLAPWADQFLFELSAFPRGKHDDWLDAWTQAREALSGDGISDSSTYTAENVLRLEEFTSVRATTSSHPECAGRGEGFNTPTVSSDSGPSLVHVFPDSRSEPEKLKNFFRTVRWESKRISASHSSQSVAPAHANAICTVGNSIQPN